MIPLRKSLLVALILALTLLLGACAVAQGPMVRPAAPAPAPVKY